MRPAGKTSRGQVIRLNSDCMTCLLKKELEHFPEELPEEERLEYKQRILLLVGSAKPTMSPSEITRSIYEVQKEMFGIQTDFLAIKSFFNKKLMQYEERTERWIREAPDPLLRAIQFSMCGNYIDFGVPHEVSEEKMEQILRESDRIRVPEDMLHKIREQLAKARLAVFLHDNCGEIVLDKLLVKEMRRQFPQLEIVSVVRGSEVLNDVTEQDAEEVGLADVARVLPNGDDVAGTCMERISEECRTVMENADVIFSKGQGNFETLRGCGLNIFYLFLCKCELFQRRFHVPEYAGIVVHEQEESSGQSPTRKKPGVVKHGRDRIR